MKRKDTQKTILRYQKLIEISRDLASTLDLDSLLRRIIQVAIELSDAVTSSILLYDDLNKQLYFQSASDPVNEARMRGIVVPTESIAGWVAINRQPQIITDVHQDNRFFEKVEKELKFPTKSLIAIPMIAKDKLIGVLEVLNKHHGNFTLEDQEILSVLGAQAAVAIENSRLFQQSDLISELVHELRTPLSSISTISYLLQRPEISEKQRQDLAKSVFTETQRLNEMASSFLDIARLESGRFSFHLSTFDFNALLNDCCEFIKPKAVERGITINLIGDPALPQLEADRDKIRQVLLNLLSNAVKYNRPGGKITIRAWAGAESLNTTVMDTGYGIAESDLPRMFSKFFRAHATEKTASGTGLGLSICKRIIDSHGGQITVASTQDVGTTFTVRLPLKQTK